MAAEELSGRHMELLKVLHEVAANNPDGVADMDKAAQWVGFETVGSGSEDDPAPGASHATTLKRSERSAG
jgi:hypothetical protein